VPATNDRHLSAEAKCHLEAIGDYIARDNPARALSFLQESRSKCTGLTEMPAPPAKICPVCGGVATATIC
jgi:plasmid stabilization system protein ParE